MADAAEPTVALDGVYRAFGPNPALADLTLRAQAGHVTVLLGPNGAGKTTAIRVITGALDPDAGSVRVFGLDPKVDGNEVRRRCGVVSAKPSLYDRLSGYDNLLYSAELYGLGRGPRVDAAIRAAAARFGIDHALDQQAGGYSTGMKTRLALSRSMLHDPDLLLFDEPTSGLDPESSFAVLDLIRATAAGGATVVMCTHLLLEAEGLADQVVVLDGGRDLVAGSPAELSRRYWPTAVVRLDAEDPTVLDRLAMAEGVLGYERPADSSGPAVVQLDDLARVPDLVLLLAHEGVRLTRVEPHTPTLEDLYFAVRGRTPMGHEARRAIG
jgi:ABC-2 type transport system ATP-binding protein